MRSFISLLLAVIVALLFIAPVGAATLTPTVLTRAGFDFTASSVAADAAKTDKFTNDGVSYVVINNASGGNCTVTLNWGTGATVDGQVPTARTVVITTGHTVLIGPFPTNVYSDVNGFMSWTYSTATSVTVAVVKPGT